jgi:hypothetical protein
MNDIDSLFNTLDYIYSMLLFKVTKVLAVEVLEERHEVA